MKFEEIIQLIDDWAEEKGIHNFSNFRKQLEKTQEELDELNFELDQPVLDEYRIRLEIGDILVTLNNAAWFLDIDLTDCLQDAYNKISKRSGRMINGKFVKNV